MRRPTIFALAFLGLAVPPTTSAQQRITGDFFAAPGMVYSLGSGGTVGRVGAAVGWKCAGRTLQVVYVWDKLLAGRRGNVQVTFSVDQGSPHTQEWRLDSSRLFATMPRNLVAEFTRAAKAGRVALFAVRDLADGETQVDAVSLMGLTRSLPRLRCSANQRRP